MARKTVVFTATDGRDEGKQFFLTELSATEIEDWAAEAFFLLINSGVELPEDVEQMGIAGLMKCGLETLGKVPYKDAKPLLNKMFECVQIMPDKKNPDVLRFLIESDIEEVQTRLKLRKTIWDLHTGFLSAGAPSKQAPATE